MTSQQTPTLLGHGRQAPVPRSVPKSGKSGPAHRQKRLRVTAAYTAEREGTRSNSEGITMRRLSWPGEEPGTSDTIIEVEKPRQRDDQQGGRSSQTPAYSGSRDDRPVVSSSGGSNGTYRRDTGQSNSYSNGTSKGSSDGYSNGSSGSSNRYSSYSNGASLGVNTGYSNGSAAVADRQPVIEVLEPSTAPPSSSGSVQSTARMLSTYPDMVANRTAMPDAASPREVKIDTSYRWARTRYNTTQRTFSFWAFALTLRARLTLLDQKWSYIGGFTEAKKSARTRKLAAWTRDTMLSLGPLFIKVGQLIATRADLLPAEATEEMSQLQDRVPAFPPVLARKIIEEQLGASVEEAFASFSMKPLAAASLGQVHRARLKTGEDVVVKVQRPGLKPLFDIDLKNLKALAKQLDKGDDNSDFLSIWQECSDVLFKEIDYILEGRSADRFRRNFQDTHWVQAPKVHWGHTTRNIITLEYLPGTKISDTTALMAAGLDVKQVARRATECYLTQVLTHGFLHSDPHPGNIAINPQGDLIFYDFGMMSSIVPATKERLLDVFYGVYRKDAKQVIDALQALGIIASTGNDLALQNLVQYALENLTKQAERNETISAIGEDLFSVAVDQPFRFPAAFTFVLRAFSTLEGLGKALDPDYSFAVVAQPFGEELLNLQDESSRRGFVVDELRRSAVDVGTATVSMPQRVQRINTTMARLEAGTLKPRVRVLESERADRRNGLLQVATIQAVGGATAAQIGTQLELSGNTWAGTPLLIGAAVLTFYVGRALWRVSRLDRFEKQLKR